MDHRARTSDQQPPTRQTLPTPANQLLALGAPLEPPAPTPRCGARQKRAEWDELVDRYHRYLGRRIYYTLVSKGVPRAEEHVEELLQDVYFRLFRRYRYDLGDLLGAEEAARRKYLRKTVDSAVNDMLRHRRAEKRGEAQTVSLTHHEAACRRTTWGEGDPEDCAVEHAGLRSLLGWIRSQLREGANGRRELTVLLLRAVEERSSREIAHLLPGGLTRSAIESIYHRLLLRLQKAGPPLPA